MKGRGGFPLRCSRHKRTMLTSDQSAGELVESLSRFPLLKHPASAVPLMNSAKSQDMHLHNIDY